MARPGKAGPSVGGAFPGTGLQCGCGLASRGVVYAWANRALEGCGLSGERGLKNPARPAPGGSGLGGGRPRTGQAVGSLF